MVFASEVAAPQSVGKRGAARLGRSDAPPAAAIRPNTQQRDSRLCVGKIFYSCHSSFFIIIVFQLGFRYSVASISIISETVSSLSASAHINYLKDLLRLRFEASALWRRTLRVSLGLLAYG